ncbi:hypothetical protein EV702DRAFT_1202081 [Suillus placidus]|uniref:F-box domain-containing protein n=1 Tax=Suillus placidus TaxID=48579 RepID=A0A9P6ZM55_9AGAM|nr:hypothetical protein EV702DRAFT_1202081 [Suillus placidus]
MQSQTVDPKVDFSSFSDTIGVLQNILARSQVTMPDLETPYSRANFAPANHSAIELKDHSISAIITERQQQLDGVLHEISGLETVIDSINNICRQLVEKKDKIVQSINLHKKLVMALWRLPNEVTSQIFVHCLPKHHRLWPSSKLAPMLLTRICRRWRDVAVSLPSLWCSLRLDADEVHDRHWQPLASCYDSWLRRSRGLPLSLEVWCYAVNSTIKIRSLIQPYINQISSLSIHFPLDADEPEHILIDLPALQELTVGVYGRSAIPAIAQSVSRLSFTLRDLKVTWPVFHLEHLSVFNSLLAHLTNLEVVISHMDLVPHLLHLCPNLSSLTIRAGAKQLLRTIEPFTHTKLRSLRVAHDLGNTIHLAGLFVALSLPNLRLLEARYIQPSQTYTLFDALPPPNLLQLEARYEII